MYEVPNDPFPKAWADVKSALGLNLESPTGAGECIRDAFGTVSDVRNGIGSVIDFFRGGK